MARRGTPYRGALFCGLIATADGPRVLEFNVRMGDPETQAIMPRLDLPLAEIMLECATGRLSRTGVLPALPNATVALFLAADGYPEASRKGDPISGLDAAAETALIFGAGVAAAPGGELVTAGGRVLTVVGRSATVEAAADIAYAAAGRVGYDGKWYRHDIGRQMAGAVA